LYNSTSFKALFRLKKNLKNKILETREGQRALNAFCNLFGVHASLASSLLAAASLPTFSLLSLYILLYSFSPSKFQLFWPSLSLTRRQKAMNPPAEFVEQGISQQVLCN